MSPNMVFRYQGIIDFRKIYEEGKDFFIKRSSAMDIAEKKHKEKDDEIEIMWEITQPYDVYTRIKYDIEFKIIDVKRITVSRDGHEVPMVDGKLRMYVSFGTENNYGIDTPAGKLRLFEEKSLLHKLYKTVTERDRSDLIDDVAAITATEFVEFVKSVCNVDARS